MGFKKTTIPGGIFVIMKKILICVLLALLAGTANPELVQDPKTFRYYSLPDSPEIDQNLYHILVWNCKDVRSQFIASIIRISGGNGGHGGVWMYGPQRAVTTYLQRIASPTSIRLLEDLQKINFVLNW